LGIGDWGLVTGYWGLGRGDGDKDIELLRVKVELLRVKFELLKVKVELLKVKFQFLLLPQSPRLLLCPSTPLLLVLLS
jgi:hypothetical protein